MVTFLLPLIASLGMNPFFLLGFGLWGPVAVPLLNSAAALLRRRFGARSRSAAPPSA